MATFYQSIYLFYTKTAEQILILKTRALIAEMMEKKVYKRKVYKRKEVKNQPYKQSKRYTKMIR
jgi:hypothetical protein